MRKLIAKALPTFLLALTTAPALMAANNSPLSYSYVEFGANYTKDLKKTSKDIKELADEFDVSVKNTMDKSSGGLLNLSFEVGSNAFILIGAEGAESKKMKLNYSGAYGEAKGKVFNRNFVGHFGFGGYAPMLDNLDLVGEMVYLRSEHHVKVASVDVKPADPSVDNFKFSKTFKTKDNGWSAGLGVRSVFANWFELNGFVRHADIFNEKNTIYTVGTKAHMSLFSLGLDVSEYHTRSKRSATHVDLTARFSF